MRNTFFAAAAAFALVLGTAPTFAAEASGAAAAGQKATQQDQVTQSNDSLDSKCASILASPSGHPAGDFEYCESMQP